MSKREYKVCREGVEVGFFDALEIIDLFRSGNVLETDDFYVEFEGVWEKFSVLGPLMMANDMECLYRLIKSHACVSINDLVRLSRMSERDVRYYIGFFLWYGVATDADDAGIIPDTCDLTNVSSSHGLSEVLEKSESNTPEVQVVLLTERNINFVEGFKSRRDGKLLSALEFFVDAYVELPGPDGFDD